MVRYTCSCSGMASWSETESDTAFFRNGRLFELWERAEMQSCKRLERGDRKVMPRGVGSETPLLACMHVGDLHLKSSEAEAASQSRSHPFQSSGDSNKHVIAITATDHRISRFRSPLPNHVRWASKVGGVKLQNCCRYVRHAGRATPCAISVETKNPVCICHDLLLSWRAATVLIELFQAHGA